MVSLPSTCQESALLAQTEPDHLPFTFPLIRLQVQDYSPFRTCKAECSQDVCGRSELQKKLLAR